MEATIRSFKILCIVVFGLLPPLNTEAARYLEFSYSGPEFYLTIKLEEGSRAWNVQGLRFIYRNPLRGINPFTTYQMMLEFLGSKKFDVDHTIVRNEASTAHVERDSTVDEVIVLDVNPDRRPQTMDVAHILLFVETGEIVFSPFETNERTNPGKFRFLRNQIYRGKNLRAQVRNLNKAMQESLPANAYAPHHITSHRVLSPGQLCDRGLSVD